MKKLLSFIPSFFCVYGYASPLADNQCAVIVASRQTMAEVQDYVREKKLNRKTVKIYPATNGWLAIGVAVIDDNTAKKTLIKWKKSGKIPSDSFCSSGKKFAQAIALPSPPKKQAPRQTATTNDAKSTTHKPLFADGQCAVVVASRDSLDAVKAYLAEQHLDPEKTAVYPTSNGWYAISVDVIALQTAKKTLNQLKAKGSIPQDSFCSTGKTFRPAIRLATPPVKLVSTASDNTDNNNAKGNTGKTHTPLVAPKYRFKGRLSDGLALVEKDGKWGFIDAKDSVVIPLRYEAANAFNGGVAVVKQGGKFALINTAGKRLSGFDFERIERFDKDLAIAVKNSKFGFINRQGKTVVPFEYSRVEPFVEGIAFAIKNGKKVLLNRSGDDRIDSDYHYIGTFRQGLAAVEKKGQWGYINRRGQVVIPLQFDFAGSFRQGLARVQQNGRYGYINKQGKMVIAPQFTYAEDFNNGYANVEKDGTKQTIRAPE